MHGINNLVPNIKHLLNPLKTLPSIKKNYYFSYEQKTFIYYFNI